MEAFLRSSGVDDDETYKYLSTECRVLVVGAGALGCEILYGLCMAGFGLIEILDMDTIEVSNLNRQFLYRDADVGRPKAEVAAEAAKRLWGVSVTPHVCAVQALDANFFAKFNVIIGGLDNIKARRYINGVLHSLLVRDGEGNVEPSSIIPWFDGGTEAFSGQCRTILPGMTPCFECNLWTLPTKKTYPLCTIADRPRAPEHCIEYALVIEWPKEHGEPPDMDDPNVVDWLYETAAARAAKFNIEGVTHSLVLGVVKNIVPAVASTNAMVAAGLVAEAVKIASYVAPTLNNYLMIMGTDGINIESFQVEKDPNCLVCGTVERRIEVTPDTTLEDLLRRITKEWLLEAPSISQDDHLLFIEGPLRSSQEHNLQKTLDELAQNGQFNWSAPLHVTDTALYSPIALRLIPARRL